MKSLFAATFVSLATCTHLDNTNNVFTDYSYDEVRFKTQTNCQLDTYPEVSNRPAQNPFFNSSGLDKEIPRWKCCPVP